MSLFQRIQNSFRADAHGVVDALEDEALILKQCLRDAEAEVQRKRARLVQLEADWKRFGAERERAQKEVDRAERDVSLALAKDREDLARYALKQALTQKNLVERIGARMAESAEEQRELGLALQSQQVTLEELRARVQAFLSQRESGCLEVRVLPVTDEQIELELMRRKAQPAARAEDAPEARDGSK